MHHGQTQYTISLSSVTFKVIQWNVNYVHMHTNANADNNFIRDI